MLSNLKHKEFNILTLPKTEAGIRGNAEFKVWKVFTIILFPIAGWLGNTLAFMSFTYKIEG